MRRTLAIGMALLLAVGCYGDSPTATHSAGQVRALLSVRTGIPLEERQLQLLARAVNHSSEVYVAQISAAADSVLEHARIISLPLSPSTSIDVKAEQFRRRKGNRISWGGRPVADSTGWVQLVLGPSGMYATIRHSQKVYRIEPLGNGLHSVSRLEVERFPVEEVLVDGRRVQEAPSYLNAARALHRLPTSERVSFGGSISAIRRKAEGSRASLTLGAYGDLDVVVAYTPAAASATADIDDLIALAIDETNTTGRPTTSDT